MRFVGSHEQCTRPTGVHRKVKNHSSTIHEQCTLSPKAETRAKKKKKKRRGKRQMPNVGSSGSKHILDLRQLGSKTLTYYEILHSW